jgi:23S rRNA pseudouridine1911/1915/1917 synthase
MSMTVKVGRSAISYFKKIEEYGHSSKKPFASWLEVTLETGRTHQVRVHLTGIGHSILGDPVYGNPSQTQSKWQALPENVKVGILNLPGQALHARVLGFKHPITGKNLRFEAEPPPGFTSVLKALKQYC